jgi:hypothetical protein
VGAVGGDCDADVGAGVADRVVEEVAHEPVELVGITGQVDCDVQTHLDRDVGGHGGDDIASEGGQIEMLTAVEGALSS